jgi:signal peptidase I
MATTRNKVSPESPGEATRKPTPRVAARDNLREIIESVAIAFVLAFLFRAFEAEAFVIPTGSMAPTLMGQHKDLFCPKCGFHFRVNASDSSELRPEVTSCTCPNCRYQLSFGDRPGSDGPVPRSYKGDRIIVAKFPYEVRDPQRWDVGVFKYPIRAKVNFIKRIVGLPNETMRIYHGDLFRAPTGSDEFEIVRKPPEKIQAMLQVVYDNDHPVAEILERGWPERWHNEQGGSWSHPDGDLTRFATDGKTADAALRYSHLVPTSRDWERMQRGPLDERERSDVRPRLIGDFYAYNSADHRHEPHWVGDLALECELDVRGSTGEIVLELVEANRAYRCTFDVQTGAATLSAEGINGFAPRSTIDAIKGPGRHQVRFANVDDRLTLWIDGDVIPFGGETGYVPYPVDKFRGPGEHDRSPVAITARSCALEVSHLRVLRDIYYIADRWDSENTTQLRGDLLLDDFPDEGRTGLTRVDSDEVAARFRWVEFRMGSDDFLALGDNSPSSKDSRLWEKPSLGEQKDAHFVKRDFLIGKAMFIYWPHALDRIPYTRVPFPVAIMPNVERMKFIH